MEFLNRLHGSICGVIIYPCYF